MRRRDFVTLLGGATALLSAATRAQQSAKVWRIGYLGFGPASSWASEVEALQSGLRDLGYVDGKNLIIEFRWADRADQTFGLATRMSMSSSRLPRHRWSLRDGPAIPSPLCSPNMPTRSA
jgi:putative ABC transport system substrate-binding protein